MNWTTADGTVWVNTQASYLVHIPVWKGNRVMDPDHANRIYESIDGDVTKLAMNPFRIVDVQEPDAPSVRYIIDGQHRVSLLKRHFQNIAAPDFNVMVAMNTVTSEDEVIRLFKKVNLTKSMEWREDPVLIANKLIEALMTSFNTDTKRPLIRSGVTRKPYMNAGKLREALVAKKIDMSPHDFVTKAHCANLEMLRNLVPDKPSQHDAIRFRFALGLDEKFTWI